MRKGDKRKGTHDQQLSVSDGNQFNEKIPTPKTTRTGQSIRSILTQDIWRFRSKQSSRSEDSAAHQEERDFCELEALCSQRNRNYFAHMAADLAKWDA